MIDATLHLPASFLHEAFSDCSGVPLDFFELYYRGKRLEGEAALVSWGIGKGATIEVKMRGRGGMQQQATQEEPSSSAAHAAEIRKGAESPSRSRSARSLQDAGAHGMAAAEVAGAKRWAKRAVARAAAAVAEQAQAEVEAEELKVAEDAQAAAEGQVEQGGVWAGLKGYFWGRTPATERVEATHSSRCHPGGATAHHPGLLCGAPGAL